MRRLALVVLMLFATAVNAAGVTITELRTSLGGNQYQAELTVTNDSFAVVDPFEFTFRLYFEPQYYGPLSVLQNSPFGSGGSFLEAQPGLGDFDYGTILFDVFGDFAPGASQGGFVFSFTWLEPSLDARLAPNFFEVLDRQTVPFPSVIGTGFTTVSAVPEPETYAMLLAGLGLLGFEMKRRRKTTYA